MNAPSQPRDPDEDRDIYQLIDEVIPQPSQWLDTPNELLGGEKPQALLPPRGSNKHKDTEEMVRQLVRSFKQGMFS